MKDNTEKIYDVAIVGAGPAGLYTAYEIIRNKPKAKIIIFEAGQKLDSRKCPAIEHGTKCVKCQTCSIMSGEGGCGAFSDGKFPITNDFGGNLWEYIGKEKSLKLQQTIDIVNRRLYYQSKGCEDAGSITRFELSYPEEKYPKLYSSKNSPFKKICTQHNLHLLDADIRHLGTDVGQLIYKQLITSIESSVEILANRTVYEIKPLENCYRLGIKFHPEGEGHTYYKAKNVVVAAGRSGSKWVKQVCNDLGIQTKANRVDIGVRFECPDEIWNHITKELYESKIVYKTKTYEDEVRTFCMNPSGFVVNENTNGLITVNGHAFEDKNKKSNNTNFALLVSKTFTEPFNNSNEYGEAIIRLSNMLGGGAIVQRYGDLIRGKRTTKDRLARNTVTPTLNAEPGDLSLVLPKRILDDIVEMIERLDHLVPGMTNDDNLLFGVEAKFYNFTVNVNKDFSDEDFPGLYFIGDGAGITHSLSQASANGLYVGAKIAETLKEEK